MRRLALTPAVGPVAGGFGLAVGQLVAACTAPSSAPLDAVGSVVIDHTPTGLKDWAIAHFGVHDKTILVGSVLVVVLVVTVAIGLLARRRLVVGLVAMVALTAIAAACAVSRPDASALAVVPSTVAALASCGALVALLWPTASQGGDETEPSMSRRSILLGAFAAATVVLGEAGRRITADRSRPEDIALPRPVSLAEPLPPGLRIPGISPFRTPNHSFYRVDTRLDVPVVDSDSWTLTVDGNVEHPFTIDFRTLLGMPMIERDITLTCVSNSVGGPYVGGARWLGVRLRDLLDRAGVRPGSDQILSTDVDGMTISTPLHLATDGRDAMVAVGMNGAPLPREHGFPARLVVPGLYGFISATKWVTRLTLTTYTRRHAYWTQRGWATDAPIKISSRIDTPRPLQQLHVGEVIVGGVAWAQENGGVARVEVKIDEGPWQRAELGPSGGNDYWRQWYHRWDATPGQHTLACRVVDGAGQVQTAVRANPFPSGASGIESIDVSVG